MRRLLVAMLAIVLVAPGLTWAGAKTYQVTGKVIELKDKTLTVDKDGEKFEMERNAATKVKGDLAAGVKVTARYRMTTDIAKAAGNSYQVTGPVLKMTDTLLVIDKAGSAWEIEKSGEPSVTGELKLGAKVTLKYAMTATDVEVKPASPEKKAEAK
jgi:hypothetical protein